MKTSTILAVGLGIAVVAYLYMRKTPASMGSAPKPGTSNNATSQLITLGAQGAAALYNYITSPPAAVSPGYVDPGQGYIEPITGITGNTGI